MGSRQRARFSLHLATFALLCAGPVTASAQGKNAFVEALIQFSRAAAGTDGDEATALRASLDGLTAGLASWDASVGRVESGFKGAIGSAVGAQAAQMRMTLAAAYLERGRAVDALTVLSGAPVAPAAPPVFHLLRATAQQRAGNAAAGATAFRRAFAADPTGYLAAYPFLQATVGNPGADRQPAIDALVQAALGIASGQASPGLSFLSFNLLDDASAEVPLFAMSIYAEGAALLAVSRFAEALAQFRKAAQQDPSLTDVGRTHDGAREAAQALARGDGRAAAEAAQRVPMGDRSSEVQRLLGLAYWTSGDYAKSLQHLEAAVRLNPLNERARLALADVLVAAGRPQDARAALLNTTKTLPRSGQAWWRLARLALDAGDEPAALTAYEQSARLAPIVGASLVHAAVGRLRHNALNLDGAVQAHRARVAMAPASVAAHVDLGRVFVARDQLADAAAEFAAAVLLEPTSADALVALGQLRGDAGHDVDAMTLLRAATKAAPSHAEAHYALSRVLRRAGSDAEADAELEVFRRLQREAMDAQRRRFEENSQVLEKLIQGRPQ